MLRFVLLLALVTPVFAQTITLPAQNVSATVPAQVVVSGTLTVTEPAHSLTCALAPLSVDVSTPNVTASTVNCTQAAYTLQVVNTPPPPPPTACGQQLGSSPVIFCYTFDSPLGVSGTRTGDLDPNVWGVSRTLGVPWQYNGLWNAVTRLNCDGSTSTVTTPNDVFICNGQLREAVNDNNSLQPEAGDVTSLAMYPKQPFDFAGRTGTVSFDVSNDTSGVHSAWPEFWMSDLPVPDPFNHFNGTESLPANGLAVRFGNNCDPGQQCVCPNANNLNQPRWAVDSVAAVRSYVLDDTNGFGPGLIKLQILDCVIESTGPGNMNHVEVRISQNQIDVYATDAGVAASATTLRHIATATNAGLTFTRGLIWLEDVHYNADKGDLSYRPTERQHTFSWDNLAFDGPFTGRDFTYDAPDYGAAGPNGALILGQMSSPNGTTTWTVNNLPTNLALPSGAKVLFNWSSLFRTNPSVINVTVNGHAHQVPFPYPDTLNGTWRTFAVTIPLTDLLPGTNTVLLGADQTQVWSNVDIALTAVAGGVPVLPDSNNAYP